MEPGQRVRKIVGTLRELVLGADDESTSLKHRAMLGAVWSLGGQGVRQGIRLAGNLILTRLLFPEAFGLVAMVTVVVRGITMFSDVGIRGSILSDKQGEDPRFLNTAWTVQIARGFIIWIAISSSSWLAASFYEEPALLYLIPVMGLTSAIKGFRSTAVFSLVRRVAPRRTVLLEAAGQVAALTTMVVLAVIFRSVWALVAGEIIGALVGTALSHRLIAGYRNRIEFDREAFKSLFRFGRWIFVAVFLAFFIDQGDRLILGRLLTVETLGVFSIAAVFARLVSKPVSRLSLQILQPVYARLLEQGGDVLRQKTYRVRAILLAATLPVMWTVCLGAQPLIDFLYDDRYAAAGWMLQILATRAIVNLVGSTSDRTILAGGDSFQWMILQMLRALFMAGGMYFGYQLGGLAGFLWGMTAGSLLSYVPLAVLLRKYGVWMPALDVGALAASAAVIGTGITLLY